MLFPLNFEMLKLALRKPLIFYHKSITVGWDISWVIGSICSAEAKQAHVELNEKRIHGNFSCLKIYNKIDI